MSAGSMRPDRKVGLLLALATGSLFVALGVSVILPAADPALGAAPARTLPVDGARVYRTEGCWYCHTQQVRQVVPDAGLGEPLAAGAYRDDHPSVLGAERVGADLTHVGSRLDEAKLRKILSASYGSMPSYGYLSRKDTDALASYLLALK